ncbi:hypothetical protein LLG46_01670 [bacterium]|nr:hypothetical protein [bacterium]
MKLDKQQVPQLIVLGVLVLICIGYVSFKVISPGTKPPPAPVCKADHQTENSSATDESTDTEVSSLANGTFPDLMVTPPRRDPFAPVASLEIDNAKTNKPVETTRPSTTRVDKPYPSVRVPKIEANPFNPFRQSATRTIQSEQIQVQEQEPEFALTGIIRGDRNVAIIRSDEGGRYIVKQGQLIDGRYKVESVSDDGATLVYKSRRIHVKLGGIKNAS